MPRPTSLTPRLGDDGAVIPLSAQRVRTRHFTPDDADFVLAVHQHPGLRRFIPRQVIEDADAAEAVPARIERFRRYDADPVLGVVLVETMPADDAPAVPVALIMLQPIPASTGVALQDVEIGWRAHPEHTGHGYVAEAARAVLDHVLASGLPRVVAVTDPANSASQAVCERIGMTRVGLSRDYYDEETMLFVADRPGG